MVYLDNAATTRIKPEVYEAMKPYLTDQFGNPSSIFYGKGQEAEEAINQARETIAKYISAKPDEIYFTSGGSEANNWAIKGAAFAQKEWGDHIITSKIEHPSVLNTCKFLETQGFEVTYLDVDKYGNIDFDDVRWEMIERTILVSIMSVNNEIGTIQDIRGISKTIREKDKHVLFHTDATQYIGHFKVNVNDLGVDMLSFSGHKFHAPKGVGVLYIKEGTQIEPLIHGGAQERHMRAGTQNVAGIVGMAKALEISTSKGMSYMYTDFLREKLLKGIQEKTPYIHINGNTNPYILNISFDYVESESVLMLLSQKGICVSGGSACASGSLEPSHVLTAIGRTPEEANSAVRFSLSDETTEEEIDYVLQELPPIIQRLRDMSPTYENFIKERGGE